MVKLEPDSPEWHIKQLEAERDYWLVMYKSTDNDVGRRHYYKLQIMKVDYNIEQHRQVLREKDSDGLREWLTK